MCYSESMNAVCFRSINPEENRYRFYVILWTQTLWGSWAVVRRWGRIGADQTHELVHECANLDHALWVAANQIERRLRRGYKLVS